MNLFIPHLLSHWITELFTQWRFFFKFDVQSCFKAKKSYTHEWLSMWVEEGQTSLLRIFASNNLKKLKFKLKNHRNTFTYYLEIRKFNFLAYFIYSNLFNEYQMLIFSINIKNFKAYSREKTTLLFMFILFLCAYDI